MSESEQITVCDYLEELTSGPVVSPGQSPPWFVAGEIHQLEPSEYRELIDEDADMFTWPPHGLSRTVTVQTSPAGNVLLLWIQNQRCFGRELSDEESLRLSELEGS